MILGVFVDSIKRLSSIDFKSLDFISFELQKSISNLKNSKVKEQQIVSFLLLKKAFDILNIKLNFNDLDRNSYGKPYIKNSNITFNISHSNDKIILVVSDDKYLGVDIESYDRPNLNLDLLFKKILTKKEQEYVKNSPSFSNAIINIFSIKECYLKAIGTGILSIPSLKEIEVDYDNSMLINKENRAIKFHKLNVENYCCYVINFN